MKVKIWNVSTPTRFKDEPTLELSENTFQIKEPLKRLIVPDSLSIDIRDVRKIVGVFGVIRTRGVKVEKLSGLYFPINWDKPVMEAPECSMYFHTPESLELEIRNRNGFDKALQSGVKYIVEYHQTDDIFLRGWFYVVDFGRRCIRMETPSSRDLGEKGKHYDFSDRL